MLESLEQSNIKRMSVESPEKVKVVFRPDQEMRAEDWNRIEIYKGATDPKILGFIKDIAPEFQAPEDNLEIIRDNILHRLAKPSLTATELVDILFDVAALSKVDQSLKLDTLTHIISLRESIVRRGLMHYKLNNHSDIFMNGILAAEKIGLDVRPDLVPTEEGVKKTEDLMNASRNKNWCNFFQAVEDYKYLFYPEFQIELNEDEVESIRAKLASYMENSQISDYLALMSAIKRTAPASEIKFENETPVMPEERNF